MRNTLGGIRTCNTLNLIQVPQCQLGYESVKVGVEGIEPPPTDYRSVASPFGYTPKKIPVTGVAPARPKAPDPKSGGSANSPTPA